MVSFKVVTADMAHGHGIDIHQIGSFGHKTTTISNPIPLSHNPTSAPPPRCSKAQRPSSSPLPNSSRFDGKFEASNTARPSVARKQLWTPEQDITRKLSSGSIGTSSIQAQRSKPNQRHPYPSLAQAPEYPAQNPLKKTSSSMFGEAANAAPQIKDGEETRHLLRQPETRPISQEQLVAEVKGIYAGLVMVEAKCIEIDKKHAPRNEPALNNEQWQALIALHRTLLHEHHDFYLASQHPSASPALRRLASKYSMPARMWRHGIDSFLELLRHKLPASLDHMLAFIYLAYSMMALLHETVPAFEDTWIECLGDLARYRMAIEDDDIRDREAWTGVAHHWYTKVSGKARTTGQLYHHLAILARPNSKSVCVEIPFMSAREFVKTLFVRHNTQCVCYETLSATGFDMDWTSFYHCIRFPLASTCKELLEKTEHRTDMWRRQHQEGTIDDRWTSLRLHIDEQTNELHILESRKEWHMAPIKPAEESILTLFKRWLNSGYCEKQSRLPVLDTAFFKSHDLLFIGNSTKAFDGSEFEHFCLLGTRIGRVSRKFMDRGYHIGIANSVSVLGFGSEHNALLRAIAHANVRDIEVRGATLTDSSLRNPRYLSEATTRHALQRIGDPNVLPFIHVTLAFIRYLLCHQNAKSLSIPDSAFPWQSMVTILNTLLNSSSRPERMEADQFPFPEKDDVPRPLPEDYTMRGLLWTERYFPDDWFERVEYCSEDRRLELEQQSMKSQLQERIRWLECLISERDPWSLYESKVPKRRRERKELASQRSRTGPDMLFDPTDHHNGLIQYPEILDPMMKDDEAVRNRPEKATKASRDSMSNPPGWTV